MLCLRIMSSFISILIPFVVLINFIRHYYYYRGEVNGDNNDVNIEPQHGVRNLEGLYSTDQVSSMAATKSTDRRNRSYHQPQSSSDDFVRAADAIQTAQLMETSERLHDSCPVTRGKEKSESVPTMFAIGSGMYKAKKKKEVTMETMYARPSGLMFSGTFYELRQKGKLEDKWLLINVQKEGEFNSHLLNRDVWSDECIVDMVKCNFLFWQTQDFTEEGKVYAERYHINKFPLMAILDPRTGGLVLSKENIADKDIIAEWLQDFISDNPTPSTSRPSKTAKTVCLVEDDDDVLSRPSTVPNQPIKGSGSALNAMNTLFGHEIVQTTLAGKISYAELKKQSDGVLCNFLNESHQIASSSACTNKEILDGFEVRAYDNDTTYGDSNEKKVARLMFRFPDGKKLERVYRPEDFIMRIVEDICSYLISDKNNIGKRFDIWYSYPAVQLTTAIKNYAEKLQEEGNDKDKKIDETNITLGDLQLHGCMCEVRFL